MEVAKKAVFLFQDQLLQGVLFEKHDTVNRQIGNAVFDTDFPVVVQNKGLLDVVIFDSEDIRQRAMDIIILP